MRLCRFVFIIVNVFCLFTYAFGFYVRLHVLRQSLIPNTRLSRYRCLSRFCHSDSSSFPLLLSLLLLKRCMGSLCCNGSNGSIGKRGDQFVAHLKRDQSQYVMEWCPPSAVKGQIEVNWDSMGSKLLSWETNRGISSLKLEGNFLFSLQKCSEVLCP